MDNETTLIELANAHSVAAGYSVEGLRANVVNPADRECEVVFVAAADDREGAAVAHRVFVDSFGYFVGYLLADGTRPARAAELSLRQVKGDDVVSAATRYLQAHGVDTSVFEPRLVDPPQFVAVWYELDTDEDMFGGWHTVFMLESGELIGVQEDQ